MERIDIAPRYRGHELFPSPEPPHTPVMLCEEQGYRFSLFVEPGWLDLLVSSSGDVARWDGYSSDNPAVMPWMIPGWPEDWADGGESRKPVLGLLFTVAAMIVDYGWVEARRILVESLEETRRIIDERGA